MNYIELHIGDYDKDTAHLSACEDGIYGRLLRRYYNTEQALPGDVKAVQRLVRAHSKDEKKAVEVLLNEFFSFIDGAWVHGRCDKEIAKYQAKQDKARSSANARWSKAETDSERNANAMRTHSEGNAHQSPDTRHQKEQKQERAPAAPSPAELFPDVDPGHLRDWVAARNRKRLPLTETAAKGFRREAAKAGMDIADAVKFCAEKGWAGLNANGPPPNARAGPPPAQPAGKQMQGLMALEAMKSGNRMAAGRGTERAAETVLLVAGSDARR